MSRWRTEDKAIGFALERGLSYGFCVFDGLYYCGTMEQLKNIGCLYCKTPTRPTGVSNA